MKHTRPRILRTRRPKQMGTRPLTEAARAGQVMADGLREMAGAAQRVDAHIRGAFLAGIATGPGELVMSEEAVMQIPFAVRWADNNMVTVKTSPDFVDYSKGLAAEHDGKGLNGTWIDEAGEVPQPLEHIPCVTNPKIPLSLWVEQERMKLYRELTQGAHNTLQSLSSDLAVFEAYRSFYPSDIERKLALFEHDIRAKIIKGEVPDYVQR